jgi:hypothetical protein
MRSYETHPGVEQQDATEGIRLASERVTLACRALAAAAEELRVVRDRTRMTSVEDAADMVAGETERVCEMAEELAKFATNLGRRRLVTAGHPG